jgi:hypothetical protein
MVEKLTECKSKLNISDENISIIKTKSVIFLFLKHSIVAGFRDNDESLKLRINILPPIMRFEELFGKFYNKHRDEFTYFIDTNPWMGSMGYSIATSPICSPIYSNLEKVTSYEIEQIKTSKNDARELEKHNFDIENLIKYYYDRNGNLYYCLKGNTIYRFFVKLSILKKLYALK